MREFNFRATYDRLLSSETVSLMTAIHEYKGAQAVFAASNEYELDQLLEIAKIQSTEASNSIEGIVTTKERLKMLVREKTMPKNRNEKEIAGYRDVLSSIHENYEYIPIKSSMILQLHKDLYKYSGQNIGGNYKSTENVIIEERPDGTSTVRFKPVSAGETPEAVENLCEAFAEAISDKSLDPLLLIPIFILDFLCIHPFDDGNGRMSRLLTLLLLYRNDYFVGKYISIEKLIADTKFTYYDVLKESSTGWHEGINDYEPFVNYMLGIIVAAYREFDDRVRIIASDELSKPDRVREVIKNHIGTITKTEIMGQLPDISQVTVQRALADLLEKNEIKKIGGGRYTSYTWNGEQK